MKLNENIVALRREKGITQEALALSLGVTNQAVSKWESAQTCPDIALLPVIADYFGVSIDELMGHEAPGKKEMYYVKTQNVNVDQALMEKAIKNLDHVEKVGTSYFQRKLSIGFNQAKSLIKCLQEEGYIVKGEDYTYIVTNKIDRNEVSSD